MLVRIIISLIAVSVNFSLMAQPSALYDSATRAVRENRCAEAIELLKLYKASQATNLAKHPEFRKTIDGQIALCGRFTRNRSVESVVIKGRKASDLSQNIEKMSNSTVYRVN
jgi:hypothetical protein